MAENFPLDFGKYRLLRKVAQGGMAEIFLAQDKRGNICAIKRILPHLAHEENFIRMFIDEARIVSHLDHPNIAGVYDQGKVDGYYFIAMEFVQGHSLLALSDRAKSMKMPLPRGLLSYIVAELLAGLACAHSARDTKGRHLGIVHRDVTPQNVIISYDGEVKLIDFGVAKARARLTQTEAGFTKGKLSYMSPEQARGEELDARSDLFSVGIILYEITTGSRLFNKEGPGGILGAIVNDPIPPPTVKAKKFPKELERIVMKALDKSTSSRYQSADEMRDSLLRYARKEKPPPGQSRLKDLVHDLFGDPESQKVIEQARASKEPTPAEVSAHGFVGDPSVRVRSSEIADASVSTARPGSLLDQPISDETRMMNPGVELSLDNRSIHHQKAKVEITSDGTPIVQLPIPRDEGSVPEPTLPARVRAARFLDAFFTDLKLSYREHKRRYIGAAMGVLALLLLIIAWQGGLFGKAKTKASELFAQAKALKQSSGLSETSADAGAAPTVLMLRTEPPGAQIVINGLGHGTTPQDLSDLPTNRQLTIELELSGYRARKEKITLWPNQGSKELMFTLDRMVGAVAVKSDPEGARIYIDGKRRGLTPKTLEGLPAGKPVNIKVRLKGRVSQTQTVVIPDGQVRTVFFELEVDEKQVPDGFISISTSPSGCNVWVDDVLVGTSPIEGRSARPGVHNVRAKCDNHREEYSVVTVSPGQTARRKLRLQANVFGSLLINVVPSDSLIFLNGQRIRPGEWINRLVPGRHNVRVENRSLNRSQELEIDVGPNARITRRVSLIR